MCLPKQSMPRASSMLFHPSVNSKPARPTNHHRATPTSTSTEYPHLVPSELDVILFFFAHVVCPRIHLFFLFAPTAAEQLHPWRRRRHQRIVKASYEQTTTIVLKLMERVHGQVTPLAHERNLRWKDNLASIGTLSVTHTFFVPH